MADVRSRLVTRFSLWQAMVFIGLVAIVCRWPRLLYAAPLIVAYVIGYRLSGCWDVRSWLAPSLSLAAIYLPYLGGFWGDCGHCREFWLTQFPVLPGLLPSLLATRLVGLGRISEGLELVVGGLILSLIVAGLVCLVRINRWWMIGSLTVVAAASACTAFMLYSAVRS